MKNNWTTRNTPQRQLVLKVVNASHDHPDARVIFERCKEECPQISMGTVYRNLSLLADIGAILDLPMPEGPDHYDFNITPHCHFYCRKCKNVTDVEVPKVFNEIKIKGYKVDGCQIVFTGICPNCNEEV